MKRYFGTDGIRGRVGLPPFTPEMLRGLGCSLARYLLSRGAQSVVIGRDTRSSGEDIERAFCEGLLSQGQGVSVSSLGVLPTPAVSFLTRFLRADCGIVVSASHNPPEDNGLKFFDHTGRKFSKEMEDTLEEEYFPEPIFSPDPGAVPDFEERRTLFSGGGDLYCQWMRGGGPFLLKGLRVVLDCAHGALHALAPAMFRECGADVVAELGTTPTGTNINVGVGALYPEGLGEAVVSLGADLGVAFDGDGDRVVMVDDRGTLIDGDQILACLVCAPVGRRVAKEQGVVGTVLSSLGLERFLANRQIELVRTAVGDRPVEEELEKRRWSLGGEPSGHIIMRRFLPTGDALLAALHVSSFVAQVGRPARELFPFFPPVPRVTKNIASFAVGILETDAVRKLIEEKTRGLGSSGRLVVRRSGTEPLIRIMVEGDDIDAVECAANELALRISAPAA